MASALPLTENHSDGDPAGHVLLHNDVSHYVNGSPAAIAAAVAAEAALRASGDTAAIATAAADATAKANAAQAAAIAAAASPSSVTSAVATETSRATAAEALKAPISPRVPQVPAATLVVEDPYDLAASFTHPDVVYVPGGWGSDSNGKSWQYWMVSTPYWHGSGRYENPCVFVSDDGIVWVTPAGLTNPVDVYPGGTALNSDPDFYWVGSALHMLYREHDTASGIETIHHRSSTTGISWSAETNLFDSSGMTPLNRTNMVSPTACFDGTTYHMYYSKQGTQLIHRTSADGTTWGTESVVSLPTYAGSGFSHMDVVYYSGQFYILVQDGAAASHSQTVNSSRALWLGRSSNGATFTFGAKPFLASDGFAQRMIYRSSIVVSTKNARDYFRVWVSGVSYTLDATSAGLVAEQADTGTESWYIGYTEGYDPNSLPTAADSSSVYVSGDIVSQGSVRGVEVGAARIFGRIVKAARAIFDRMHFTEGKGQSLYLVGPSVEMSQPGIVADWPTAMQYNWTGSWLPPLVITSDSSRTEANGSIAGMDFHNQASDATVPAGDYWRVRIDKAGFLRFDYYTATTNTISTQFQFDPVNGIIANKNLQTNSSSIIVCGSDRIRISTAKTPTSTADASGGTGDIARDDNFLYLKTTAGWKRATLSTF